MKKFINGNQASTIYKSIDLFAGIGGIRMGFDKAFGSNIKTVFVSEWDSYAQQTYSVNFKDDFQINGDITQINEKDVPDFDICLAGFPCQAFSLAGKRMGFDDDYKGKCRGTLFQDVARICDEKKPKVIFCENVKGLVMHDKGNTFKVITDTFAQLGYKVFYKVLNSKDFGVPQNRERIYIVCFRNDVAPESFEFPIKSGKSMVLKDIIADAPVPSKYYLSERYLEVLVNHKARHANKGNGFGYEIRDWDGISGAIVCGGMGRERNLVIDKRPHSMVPTTHIQGEINKGGVRKMTPREWARLQGFPDSYKLPLADVHLYKQLGNSVTVNVIEAIAKNIKAVLENKVKPKKNIGTTKNKGELSEVYIFLKLLADGKVYAANKDMKKIPSSYLNILKIIREEIKDKKYEYLTGKVIRIFCNGEDTGVRYAVAEVDKQRAKLWNDMTASKKGKMEVPKELKDFLSKLFITKITSPGKKKTKFHGGTVDIILEVEDYKTSIVSVVGFSCKSEFAGKATLFNASANNTNFIYKIEGNINDALMTNINRTFLNRGGKQVVAIAARMQKLKNAGCTLKFISPATDTTRDNLITSGGKEMPVIVGEMLRYYFFENEGKKAHYSMIDGVANLISTDPAEYGSTAKVAYPKKVSDLLFDMFTGIRMSKLWDGKRDVNGGYIVVLADGDVLAYHTCLADEFRNFLLERLALESPKCTRHKYMSIYKDGSEYFIKLNFQVRFRND